jgi:hypothetical protein
MEKYHIALTAEEQATLAQIELHKMDHAIYLANKKPILALVASLRKREAVPAHRLRYWVDPDYRSGRLKTSHRGLFERHGRQGDEIYTNPSFIPYLRYFLFGPDLPDTVIEGFIDQVGEPDWVSSGDIAPMRKCARKLVREHGIEKHRASDEFFKLCLEMGLDLSYAEAVRDDVKGMR